MAIAYDSSTIPAATAIANPTFTYTASGSNRLLLVGVYTDGNQVVTAMTYGGVSMTKIGGYTLATYGAGSSFWYLYGPTASAGATLALTVPADHIRVVIASYTGVDQTAGIDYSSVTGAVGNVTTGTFSSVTTSAAGDWGVILNADPQTTSLSTNMNIFRSTLFAGDGIMIADSNGSLGAAGTYTTALTWPSGPWVGGCALALKPVATATAVTHRLLTLGAG